MGEAKSGRALAVIAVLVSLTVVTLGVTWSVRAYHVWELRQKRQRAIRECRSNLKAIFVAEKSYFAEKDAYLEDFHGVGFEPERGNSFVYVVSRAGPIEDRSKATLATAGPAGIIGADEYRMGGTSTKALLSKLPATVEGGGDVGVSGTCPSCEVTAMCVANLDDDDAVEVWSVSTATRTLTDGGIVLGGSPNLDLSDF